MEFTFEVLAWDRNIDERQLRRAIETTLSTKQLIFDVKPKTKYFDDIESHVTEASVVVFTESANVYEQYSKLIVKFCREQSLSDYLLHINPVFFIQNSLFQARLKSTSECSFNSISFGTLIDLNKFIQHFEIGQDKSYTYLGAVFEHDRRRCRLKFNNRSRFQFEISYSSIRSVTLCTPRNKAWYLYIVMETPALIYELRENVPENRRAENTHSNGRLDDVKVAQPEESSIPFFQDDNETGNDADYNDDDDSEDWLVRNNQELLDSIYTVHLRKTTFDRRIPANSLVKCNVVRLEFPRPKRQTLNHWRHIWGICRNINRYSSKPVYIGNITCFPAYNNKAIPSDFVRVFPFNIKYALRCIDSLTFSFYDQLVFRDELDSFYECMLECSRIDPVALENALFDVQKALDEHYHVNAFELLRKRFNIHRMVKKREKSNMILVRRCVLSPSRCLFLPPLFQLQSRFLRNSNPDYALRVSIRDDNLTPLQYTINKKGGEEHKAPFLQEVFKSLKNGITLFERRYDFLGTSTSQLRDIGVTMYAKDPNGNTADDIRSQIGDVSHIKNVAKKISRLGLYFSQSLTFVEVSQECMTIIQDVTGGIHEETQMPFVFSDGIGMISQELALEITRKFSKERTVPYSAFQIRYAGAKGMLCLYPQLEGRQIVLRNSMTKFPSHSSSLEILKISEPRTVFLNRQIICILENLKVAREVFLELEREAFLNIFDSFLCSCKSFQIIRTYSLLHLDISSLRQTDLDFLSEPLFQGILCLAARHALTMVRTKAQIPLCGSKGKMLFGVLDEYQVLSQGEVFVQISENKQGTSRKVITGTVLVLRHPCMHPGDVRKFMAVDKPELHHIADCIVFPQVGNRPHPDELSGGDLDGDEYAIIWHEKLIFHRKNQPAMVYPSPQSGNTKNQVTVDDMIQFCIDFMKTESVGVIANAHLALADASRKGIFMDQCMQLAKQYAVALDFAKTGSLNSANVYRPEVYPDFMEKCETKPSYISEKVLGDVFKFCDTIQQNTHFTEAFDFDRFKNSALLTFPTWKNYEVQAAEEYEEYCRKISIIQKKFGIENELALVSGLYSKTDKYLSGRSDKTDLKTIIDVMVREVFNEVRASFFKDVQEDDELACFGKASAWYLVTLRKNKETNTEYYAFPWIVSDVLCRMARQASGIQEHSCCLKPHKLVSVREMKSYDEFVSYLKERYGELEARKIVSFSGFSNDPYGICQENLTTVCLSLKDDAFRDYVLRRRSEFLNDLKDFGVSEVTCEIYDRSHKYPGNLYVTFTGTKCSVNIVKKTLMSRSFYSAIIQQ